MRHTNRRADGDGLSSEPQKWSAAGTCRNPQGSTVHSFVKVIGIHFVYGMEDVKELHVYEPAYIESSLHSFYNHQDISFAKSKSSLTLEAQESMNGHHSDA